MKLFRIKVSTSLAAAYKPSPSTLCLSTGTHCFGQNIDDKLMELEDDESNIKEIDRNGIEQGNEELNKKIEVNMEMNMDTNVTNNKYEKCTYEYKQEQEEKIERLERTLFDITEIEISVNMKMDIPKEEKESIEEDYELETGNEI
ncbi:hypothetical protein FQR65_LT05645 [Abscondita terminalis]|nr:hypothetical protein FQR65_LT05645 [Abscondita terminalis]